MEKVIIKPVTKEILIKGGNKEGSSDLFSYDYDSDQHKRKLGHLYVVGNIQSGAETGGEELDIAYVTNLVASLAKREYYSKPNLSAKEAFSASLKKINGVVEEFFKKQDTKINVGIFTVAGDEIHISKIGKFKIILSRDGKNIDILNNVDLFNKEKTQEKEFSNIISGKIREGDKILAFYPSRAVTSREKYIKDHFSKSPVGDFEAKLASIKETKPDFACAALHLEIQKTTESAEVPKIEPKELAQAAVAEAETESEPKVAEKPEAKVVEAAEQEEPKVEEKAAPEPKVPAAQSVSVHKQSVEFPRIIPSEFALGKKTLPFVKFVRRLGHMNINSRNRNYLFGGIAVLAIVAFLGLKTFVFVSPAQRELNKTITQAQANLKSAEAKISQNDLVGARALLVSTLADISGSQDSKIVDTRTDIMKALDSLDNASDATLSVVAEIPSETGTASLIAASGNDLYAYLSQSGTGRVVKVSGGNISKGIEVKDINPTSMFGSENYITLLDSSAKKASSLSLQKSTVAIVSFSGDSLISGDVYQDNLYGLTSTNIAKVADISTGHSDLKTWLQDGTSLPSNPTLITVDGKVYVLSANGTLTTYYKGQKTNEANTAISTDASNIILTSADSPELYIVDKKAGRIHVIKKDSGSLSKTLKVNSDGGISGAALTADGTLYILSGNKVSLVK